MHEFSYGKFTASILGLLLFLFVLTLISYVARRVYPMTRSEIYGSLKELNSDKSDSSLSFADIFNCRAYWEKGVFANLSDS
jgi:hypothetical protein